MPWLRKEWLRKREAQVAVDPLSRKAGHFGAEDEGTVVWRPDTSSPEPQRHASGNGADIGGGRDGIGLGSRLKDRFVIEKLLGSGGMGKVFLALDIRKQEASDRNPWVAVKILKESFRDHPSSMIALQREARKAQELSHPNIIKVYDFDRDGDCFYITMEYLTGRSLDKIIQSKDFSPMSQAEAGRIVKAVGAALSFAHSNGFVHADLKPGNIFITDTDRVKVIDFGLARAIKRNEEDVTAFAVESLGAMTPAYASPEMLELQPPHPRDDVFALACITYELLSGRHPFSRMPATHAREAGARPTRIRGLSKSQWQALERALCFDPARRTASVDAFVDGISLGRPQGLGRRLGQIGLAACLAGLGGVALAAFLSGHWSPFPGPPASAVVEAPEEAAPPANAAIIPAPPSIGAIARTADPPGTDQARDMLGRWCGSAFGFDMAPARWSMRLPGGAETTVDITRYERAGDRIVVYAVTGDGKQTGWEFGQFSPDNRSMVQLRGMAERAADWRNYNRPFQRC